MKSKERLTYEQTQFLRQIVNQSHHERGRSRGRGSNGRFRSGQHLIQIASTEDIQRQAESEKGYVPDYVEGAR